MQFVRLDTGFNIEVDFSIAPFHRRWVAWLVDFLICWGYIKIISSILGLESLFIWILDFNGELLKSSLASLPVFLYDLVSEVFMNGQSVGKKVMNIRVFSAGGGQPSLSQYLIRWLFRTIDFPIWIVPAIFERVLPWWCAAFLLEGIGCILLSRHSQRIGDLVAGTIIIDIKTRTSWEDTVFTELESGYQPRFPQVMQMSDKDINTLKSIIGSVKRKGDYDLSMRIGERIKSKLHIESDQDSLDFLETLLKDYNYYSTR